MLDYLKYLYGFFLLIALAITFRVDRAFQGTIELERKIPGENEPEPEDPDDTRPLLVMLGSLLLVLGSVLPFPLLGTASPIFGRLLFLGAAIYAILLSRWRLYKKVRFPAGIALSMVLFTLLYQVVARAEDPALAAKFSSYQSQLLPFVLPCAILCTGVLVLFTAAGRSHKARREDRPQFARHIGDRWKQEQPPK